LTFAYILYNQIELCEISKNFPWQTIWDLSEKFQLEENTDWRWKVDFSKSHRLCHNFQQITWFIYHFIGFWPLHTFCIIRLSFARSQKISLDKQSETCQKSSSSRKILIGGGKWISQNHTDYATVSTFCMILYHFIGFLTFAYILYNQIELCEISKNFPWQTIRDLSEQFQLLENTDWRRKKWFTKNRPKSEIKLNISCDFV
jgi:hypothetical protein